MEKPFSAYCIKLNLALSYDTMRVEQPSISTATSELRLYVTKQITRVFQHSTIRWQHAMDNNKICFACLISVK